MNSERYCSRIGADPAVARRADDEALAALQRAHVASVPFETLAITGDPFGERDGEGISLDADHLFEKVVERERGGFCFELNGLFGRLLADLGFDVEARAAMVVSEDGAGPPANHRTHVVELDRRYVVDIGMGVPTMRRPLPLDGTERTDEAGVSWRVVDSDRPDADYATEYREPGDDWQVRYVFRDVLREDWYFAPTCEYLATAPESTFTGDPVVSVATADGHRKLTPDALLDVRGDETEEHAIDDPREWFDALEREFGIDWP